MKQNYIYLVSCFFLAGCAQDAFEESNLQETDVPQEIKLSAGTRGIEVAGRGVGSVGAGIDENQWNGEEITIYAFKRTELPFESENDEDIYLKGETAVTATYNSSSPDPNYNNSTSGLTFDGGPKFYPLQGAYNFVGYYADDATIGATTYSSTSMSIPIQINGTQDLMIADAKLNYSNKALLVQSLIKAGKLGSSTNDSETNYIDDQGNPKEQAHETIITNEYKKAYSSYSARRGVQPSMVFEHQLVRLNFFVKAGDEYTMAHSNDGKNLGVYISNIEVGSRTDGNIIIKNDGEISFEPQGTTETGLTVRPANTDGTLNPTGTLADNPIGDTYDDNTSDFNQNKANQVGKGILVMLPTKTDDTTNGTNKYYLANITATQIYDKDGNSIPENQRTKVYKNVKIEKPQLNGEVVEFEAGKSYDITIVVYSNQAIDITATLTGWEHGGNIEINPEDDEFQI